MTPFKIKLRIDLEFQNLISPLSEKEYAMLEHNIIKDGCREPISIWDGVILDGHNRYKICLQHNIRFSVVQINVISRQDAIAWICANQLGRRNISEETRIYLIGKRYEAEKLIRSEICPNLDSNILARKIYVQGLCSENRQHTAVEIGKEYQVSYSSVQKYGRYANAIDTLALKSKDIVPRILSGRVKMSQKKVIELSQLSEPEANERCAQIIKTNHSIVPYQETRRLLAPPPADKEKTIKDMPDYDPDAELSILTLTIPSWRGIMSRVITALSMHPVSNQAKSKLKNELVALSQSLFEILKAIMEV